MSGRYTQWYGHIFSLRSRLALTYSVLLAMFVVILGIAIYNFTSDQLLQSAQTIFQQHTLVLRSLLIQEVCEPLSSGLAPGDFIQHSLDNNTAAIYLLDKTGNVVAGNRAQQLSQSPQTVGSSLLANADAHTQQEQKISSGPFQSGLLLSLKVSSRCASHSPPLAYMVVLNSYVGEQNTLNMLLTLIIVGSSVMIIIGILTIFFVTAIMLKPLHQVTSATRELAAGDLRQRVPVPPGKDEIGDLAESFNQMANRIERMFSAQQSSEQRARRFVSDASHELRTPITSLRGFTEVLLRGAKDDPATAQHVLTLMKAEAVRMTKLVNDLLTLARLDEGHVGEPETIDLVDLAVECLQEAKKEASQECKMGLELATHQHLKISANREAIKQLLLILLDNTIKYGCTGKDKKVLLKLDKKVQQAQIQVIDHGVGIISEDVPHIFHRFYRGKNAHTPGGTPIPGAGLGLPIAMATAQAYEGSITVCSIPERETTFTVSFLCTG